MLPFIPLNKNQKHKKEIDLPFCAFLVFIGEIVFAYCPTCHGRLTCGFLLLCFGPNSSFVILRGSIPRSIRVRISFELENKLGGW